MPLYNVENPYSKATNVLSQASNTYASMDKKKEVDAPGKTVGGGIMSGLGGAMAGAEIGGLMAEPGATGLAAIGGPVPLAIGAGVGLLSYFLS